MKVKHGKSDLVIFKDAPTNNHIKGELSTRTFSLMIVDRFIFQYNQITLSSCVTFIPKTGVGLPETGVNFLCVQVKLASVRLV